MRISLAFAPRFEDVMLDGIKTCTTRHRRHGNRGDHFDAFGATFSIEDVQHVYLYRVAVHNFIQEGFNFVDDFIRFWELTAPGHVYHPNQKVWLHKFFREV